VYGLRACAIRLTNTYGPRMRVKDARQTFLGIWIRKLLEGNHFEIWDGQANPRFHLRWMTASSALLLAALNEKTNGQIYNLGGEQTVTLLELAQLLVKINGSGIFGTPRFSPECQERIDLGDYYSDWSRIRKSLGWVPKVPLRDGLERTLSGILPGASGGIQMRGIGGEI